MARGEAGDQTPLTCDEIEELVDGVVATTRGELDEAELRAILAADRRYHRGGLRPGDVFEVGWLRGLHRAMFAPVWRWAGTFRRRDVNLGIDPRLIVTSMADLVADAAVWATGDPAAQRTAALRLHHRLTQIHPFPNGNGRHARLSADLLVGAHGLERFSWGAHLDLDPADVRRRYVEALRLADHDPEDLGALAELAGPARPGAAP